MKLTIPSNNHDFFKQDFILGRSKFKIFKVHLSSFIMAGILVFNIFLVDLWHFPNIDPLSFHNFHS